MRKKYKDAIRIVSSLPQIGYNVWDKEYILSENAFSMKNTV